MADKILQWFQGEELNPVRMREGSYSLSMQEQDDTGTLRVSMVIVAFVETETYFIGSNCHIVLIDQSSEGLV